MSKWENYIEVQRADDVPRLLRTATRYRAISKQATPESNKCIVIFGVDKPMFKHPDNKHSYVISDTSTPSPSGRRVFQKKTLPDGESITMVRESTHEKGLRRASRVLRGDTDKKAKT